MNRLTIVFAFVVGLQTAVAAIAGTGPVLDDCNDNGVPDHRETLPLMVDAGVQFRVLSDPVAIATADFDGNGALDVAMPTRLDDAVSILLNDGYGGFGTAVSHRTARFPAAVAAGDLNGDQRPDIAAGGSDKVTIFINQGSGYESGAGFALGMPISTSASAADLATVDIDGDGDRDVVILPFGSQSVSIAINDGSANWSEVRTAPIGTAQLRLATGDVDGDLDIDLVLAGWGSVLLRNQGDGTFAAPVTLTTHSGFQADRSGVVLADLDGDTDLDLALTVHDFLGPLTINVLRNQGGGTFRAAVSLPGPGEVSSPQFNESSIDAADIDDDGDADLAVVNVANRAAYVFRQEAPFDFAAPEQYLTAGNTGVVRFRDVNRDGHPDVIANRDGSGGQLIVLYNDGDGDFSGARRIAEPEEWRRGDGPVAIVAADLTGDPLPDLAVANPHTHRVSILENLGAGRFGAPADITVDEGPVALAAADIDGDGDGDLIVANRYQHRFTILRNSGSGNFTATERDVFDPSAILLDKLDGNPSLDLVIVSNGALEVALNDGSGAFANRSRIELDTFLAGFTLADVSGDGVLDGVYASDEDDAIFRMRNRGDGTFEAPVRLVTLYNANDLAAGDLDGDGDIDLVAVANFELVTFVNDGQGNFAESVRVSDSRGYLYSVDLADVDRDGDPDYVVTGDLGLGIFQNHGPHALPRLTAFGVDYGVRGVAIADLNDDKSLDFAVVIEGSTFGEPGTVALVANHTSAATAPDCNADRVPDECQLAGADCDENAVPDDCQSDRDRDGFIDACDRCPNKDDGLDNDGDQVPDCLDGCPFNPGKTAPGICSCYVLDTDDDGDGFVQCLDNCPEVSNPGQADRDDDNWGDDCDECPDDGNKAHRGVCGCGVSDRDSDFDDTPDCADDCPSDGDKLSPGICGCGLPDDDTDDDDGDTVPNCLDACPEADDLPDADGDAVVDCLDRCPLDELVPLRGVAVAVLASADEDAVSIMNTATHSVIATVSVGNAPLGAALSPDGLHAYVANWASRTVSVIDTEANEVVATFSVGGRPLAIGVAADDSQAFVSLESPQQALELIDTATQQPIATVPLNARVARFATNPTGTLLITASDRDVVLIDTAAHTVTATIPNGSRVADVIFARDGRVAYASSFEANSIAVVDVAKRMIVDRIAVEGSTGDLALTADGHRLHAAYSFAPGVVVIDTDTRTVVRTHETPHYVAALSLTPDDRFLYAAQYFPGRVTVLRSDTLDIVKTVAVGNEPFNIAVGPDRRGDSNCDRRFSVADVTAIVGLIATETRAECRWDDTDRDCELTANDIGGAIRRLFARPAG